MVDERSSHPDGVNERANSGAEVKIRPIRPDDAESLVQFHGHLSALSVYRRYFSPHPLLTAAEVQHLTHVDYDARLALVAECDGQLIAVGRYERLPGTTEAEVAFVVADEFQHLGIGTLLLEHLAEAALQHGVATFVADTLADNHGMIDVFLKSGFAVTTSRQDGTVSVRFPIEPDEHYVQTRHRRHHGKMETVDGPC
jgi:GNAT superfamily N-acetyltransferase